MPLEAACGEVPPKHPAAKAARDKLELSNIRSRSIYLLGCTAIPSVPSYSVRGITSQSSPQRRLSTLDSTCRYRASEKLCTELPFWRSTRDYDSSPLTKRLGQSPRLTPRPPSKSHRRWRQECRRACQQDDMERMHEMSDPAARTSCLDCLQPRWAAEVAAVTVLNWTEACARSAPPTSGGCGYPLGALT